MNITAINQRIKRSGLKKQHIAKMSGIHYSHLSRILNGTTKRPNPKTMKKIEKIISQSNASGS